MALLLPTLPSILASPAATAVGCGDFLLISSCAASLAGGSLTASNPLFSPDDVSGASWLPPPSWFVGELLPSLTLGMDPTCVSCDALLRLLRLLLYSLPDLLDAAGASVPDPDPEPPLLPSLSSFCTELARFCCCFFSSAIMESSSLRVMR